MELLQPGWKLLRSVRGNGALASVLAAYGSCSVAEYGTWIVLLLYAYDRDGTTGTTVMVLVQLVPAALFSPYAGILADRVPPGRVLLAGYVVQAVSLGALGAIVARSGALPAVFTLAACANIGLDLVRPPQAAVFPSIVRTPDELTAANVLNGWLDGATGLAGPAVAGVVVGLAGLAPALAVLAGFDALAAAFLCWPPARRRLRTVAPSASAEEAGLLAGLATALAQPATRLVVGLCTFYYVLIGALDVLCVVLAVSVLHIGQGAAGYLNAAIGGGATLSGAVTVTLSGRPRLARVLVATLLAAVGALALIGAAPNVASAAVLLAVIGLSGGVCVTVARTLLQRAAPPELTATTFAVVETVMSVGLVSGALLVRLGMAAGGPRAALLAPAVLGVLLAASTWKRLREIDGAATIPQVEIRLLRANPIFAPLSMPVLEGVAHRLQARAVARGTPVVREGEPGDRYFMVADGRVTVTQRGAKIRTLTRPLGFGEIALVSDSPRTATVTADEDSLLYTLDKESFVGVLTGHPSSGTAARRVVTSYEDPGLKGPD